MRLCLVRQVAFQPPQTTRRIWGLLLMEREGLSLLFVRNSEEEESHQLVIATEDVDSRVFTNANATQFPLDGEDISNLANKLTSIARSLLAKDRLIFPKPDDLF